MGIWRYPLHGMFYLREQNCPNAQLVPTHRSQPANEHKSVRYGLGVFLCYYFDFSMSNAKFAIIIDLIIKKSVI